MRAFGTVVRGGLGAVLVLACGDSGATNAAQSGGGTAVSEDGLPLTSGSGEGGSSGTQGDAPGATRGSTGADSSATDGGMSSSSGDLQPPCDADTSRDPLNCGSCGHDCLGAECLNGSCQPLELVANLDVIGWGYQRLGIDEASVYYGTFPDCVGPAILWGVSKDGGEPIRIAAADPNDESQYYVILSIFIDDGFIYWTEGETTGTISDGGGKLRRVSVGGGAPELLAVGTRHSAVDLAEVDGQRTLSWVDSYRVGAGFGAAPDMLSIFRALADGTQSQTLADMPQHFDGRGSSPDLTAGPRGVFAAITVDSDKEFPAPNVETSFALDEIWHFGWSGEPAKLVAAEQRDTVSIGLDSTHVYWLNSGSRTVDWNLPGATPQWDGNGTLVRIPVGGGMVEEMASGLDDPNGITVDEHHVYWLERGAVRRLAKDRPGGFVETLGYQGNIATSGELVADGRAVYWMERTFPGGCASNFTGRLMKVAK